MLPPSKNQLTIHDNTEDHVRYPRWLAIALPVISCTISLANPPPPQTVSPRIAAIVSTYYHNSHADVIVSRLLESYTLDGQGDRSPLTLVSLWMDQVSERDIGRALAAKHGVPVCESIDDALTLGTGKLAVDGVLLIAEHGAYPRSGTGQIQYPKRRLFEGILATFEKTGTSVPVFIDKHLADTWEDAHWIYQASQRLGFPIMAGSSLPTLWRRPPADVRPGQPLREMVAVSYHTLDAYGFHALEMVQTLAEQRQGGETGIASVQCLEGQAVWEAGEAGLYSTNLLHAAIGRLERQPRQGRTLKELARNPVLFLLSYRDGFKASVLTLNGAVAEWAVAWQAADDPAIRSTLFWTQEARPFMHFTYLLNGFERMVLTGKPAWPPERTLMTSGALDALLISKRDGGILVQTPHLEFAYPPAPPWTEPPPPPAGRPISGP